MNLIKLTFGALLLSLAPLAQADNLVCSYAAVLSDRDHRSSTGAPLRDVASIIRQDRANFHKFRIRDRSDEDDNFFNSVKNREDLEQMLRRRKLSPQSSNEIINGTPYVRVSVYRADEGYYYVAVEVL
jgi:hypothetical protein